MKFRNDIGSVEKKIGDLHTHTQKDGGDSPPSVFVGDQPGDLMAMHPEAAAGNIGFMSIVEGGTERYAFVITDAGKAKDFLSNRSAIKDAFNREIKRCHFMKIE
jgi:hypothetical protein